MRRLIIFSALFILAIGGIVAAIIWGPDRDWDRGRGDRVEIVRVAGDGSETGTSGAAGSGDVIVVDGQRPFFFPFGLLFVTLFIVLLFGLFRGTLFGWSGPRGGPNRFGNERGRAWLDDWHRRQHQADPPADQRQNDTTPGPRA